MYIVENGTCFNCLTFIQSNDFWVLAISFTAHFLFLLALLTVYCTLYTVQCTVINVFLFALVFKTEDFTDEMIKQRVE